MKNYPTPPVVLCHFTLAGFRKTELSLVSFAPSTGIVGAVRHFMEAGEGAC